MTTDFFLAHVQSGTIRFAEIDDLIVILDLATEDYFILNSSGTYVWKLLLDLDGDFDAVMSAARSDYAADQQSKALEHVKLAIEDRKARGFLGNDLPIEMPRAAATHPFALKHCLHLTAWWSLARTAFR